MTLRVTTDITEVPEHVRAVVAEAALWPEPLPEDVDPDAHLYTLSDDEFEARLARLHARKGAVAPIIFSGRS